MAIPKIESDTTTVLASPKEGQIQVTPQRTAHQRRTPHTPLRGDYSELFIQKKPSPIKTTMSSGRKSSATRLAGVYPPTQIFNPSAELNHSISRAAHESEEQLTSRMDSMTAEIVTTFASVVELVMWHDKPTKKAYVKRSFLRRRVANQLALPADCFDRDPWADKSKGIITAEMVS